jgi:excisionase family DNA binding protein
MGNEMISTEEAADVLNVSVPYLGELIESGALPGVKIGDAVFLSRAEVHRHKDASISQRKAALDELTKLSQKLGLGYLRTRGSWAQILPGAPVN